MCYNFVSNEGRGFINRFERVLNTDIIPIPNMVIGWRGWETSLSRLINQGWGVRIFHRAEIHEKCARYKIQLRNPENRLIGTIRIKEKDWKAALERGEELKVQCENIYADKTKRIPALKSTAEYDYSERDIPQLLEFINHLLKADRQQMIADVQLPEADIFTYNEHLTKHIQTNKIA